MNNTEYPLVGNTLEGKIQDIQEKVRQDPQLSRIPFNHENFDEELNRVYLRNPVNIAVWSEDRTKGSEYMIESFFGLNALLTPVKNLEGKGVGISPLIKIQSILNKELNITDRDFYGEKSTTTYYIDILPDSQRVDLP